MNKNLFFLIFLLFGISLAFSAEADCQEHNVLGWAWAGVPQAVPPEKRREKKQLIMEDWLPL